MAKKTKNYVKDKQPKTLWNKIGPFVKLREYLASNITPDVYANERGLKTKIMEFFGQDVPKANVDDFSQNLWFRFLNQPNNLKEENGLVRIPDNIKSIISDRINGGWEKMAKKYGKELDSLDNKIIDGKVAGKDVSDLEELRDVTSRKLGMVEEGIDLLKKARTGEHQVFNEYNFIPDAYGDLNDLSGLSSFTMYRDDRGRMVVKDKYDFYRSDQPFGVGVVTKTLDAIGYPFEIRDYVEDKNPYEENDPNNVLLKSAIDSKNDLDKKMEIRSKKREGGVVGKQREAYEYFTNKRGMSKIQALAIIGNLMAESGLKDDIYGDNKTSYGIQQWHNERMDKLFKHAKKKGHSTPTFKDQLEFLADEYEGKTGYSNFLYTRKGKEGPGYYNYSRQDFMNADNLKDAVVAWNQGAGRPHKSVIRNDDRYNYAMEVAKNLGLEIEENSISSYGQMGFGDDGEIATSVTLPEVEVAAALPNPEAQSQERQSEEERFRTWTETYGKDIVNHLLTLDGKKDGDDSDYSMMYRQHQKESEEDKKMALINAVLPNIQLRIKGVTDN